MNSKILLLSIAVISVGLFAMPSTLSLFAGQHTFYAGEDVKCEKCHQDIYTELDTGGGSAHTTQVLKKCEGCHKTNTTALAGLIPSNGTGNYSTWAGTNVTNNTEAHAAVTMECVTCHSGVTAELEGTDEAHTVFYYNSTSTKGGAVGNQSDVLLKGANTACVGCHTHALINVTWTRYKGYDIVVDSSSGSWTMTFSMNTTAKSTTYSAGQ